MPVGVGRGSYRGKGTLAETCPSGGYQLCAEGRAGGNPNSFREPVSVPVRASPRPCRACVLASGLYFKNSFWL